MENNIQFYQEWERERGTNTKTNTDLDLAASDGDDTEIQCKYSNVDGSVSSVKCNYNDDMSFCYDTFIDSWLWWEN